MLLSVTSTDNILKYSWQRESWINLSYHKGSFSVRPHS